MGIFEFIFFSVLVGVGGLISIPLYAMRRTFNQSDVKLQIKQVEEQRKLEQIKQENYVLENRSMQLELEQIKKEREDREKKMLQSTESRRWLIENKEEAKDKAE